MEGENAAFNPNTERRPEGPWEGKTQALTPLEAHRVFASGAGCVAGAATAAATTNEAAAGGCEGPIPMQAAATAADAGLLDGPSSFGPTFASAADAGREAAAAGLEEKMTDKATADTTTAAAAGLRGVPSPLEPPPA